jgi:hypothetical protein
MLETSPLLKLPDTRPERWALLSQLIAEWHGSSGGDEGYRYEVWPECEQRLGLPIPAALKEWYRCAGLRWEVWNRQDKMMSPSEIFCEDGVLQFFIENQAVTAWGVRISDLGPDDPAVVTRNAQNQWVEQNPQISAFALHMFAYAVQFSAKSQIYGFAQPTCRKRIVDRLPPLCFPELKFLDGGFRLYGFRQLIVGVDSESHVTASGQTAEDLTPFREAVAGEGFETFQEH